MSRARKTGGRLRAGARRLNEHPALLTAARLARDRLPGDSRFGDPLSTAGREQPHVVGRRLSELTAERPGLLRETGLTALQLWQGLAETQGRGRGERELTIVFTDLADFSDWALEAGDDAALDLLRDVGQAIEPSVKQAGGEVVKWLGDGMMAVFDEPQSALDAAIEARGRLVEVTADGYEPRLRVGIHTGRPRKMGGDYLGVDVNIAARMAEEASPSEVLVSDRVLAGVAQDRLRVRKKRRFRVKGVPKELSAYSVGVD